MSHYGIVFEALGIQTKREILLEDPKKGHFVAPFGPVFWTTQGQQTSVSFHSPMMIESLPFPSSELSQLPSVGKDSAIDNVAFPMVCWTHKKEGEKKDQLELWQS